MALFAERKQMPEASLLAAGKGDQALTYTPLLQLKHHVTQHDTLQRCLHTDSATHGLSDRRNDLTRSSLKTRCEEIYAARVLTFSRGPGHSCTVLSTINQFINLTRALLTLSINQGLNPYQSIKGDSIGSLLTP
jgi:hypothetical protein